MTRPQAEQAQAAKDSIMEYYIYTQIFPDNKDEKAADNTPATSHRRRTPTRAKITLYAVLNDF